jgi:6-phosphogluconolactonase
MTFSKIGRILTALVASAAFGLGMTACGGGTIGYMWVTGTFYNQITGYKIDNFSGNLTNIIHSPFSSGGSNPTTLVVKPGGRYLMVINSGTGGVGVPGDANYAAPSGSGIAVFSVGGGGILTYQQTYFSQGTNPIWAAFDSSGNYLYVLDKYAPDYASNPSGDITAFSVANDTGRLTLVQNTAITIGNVPTNFFRVGLNPIMSKVGSGSCLFTLSPQSVSPYVINSSNGQLTLPATGAQNIPGATRLTSINTSTGTSASTFIYLTDAGTNQIFGFTGGSSACSLSPVIGGPQANLGGTANPVYSVTSTNGHYLYVANQSNTTNTTSTVPQSSISAFSISPVGQISAITNDGTNNPYPVGSGPVCMAFDPTNQYLYISNNTDSTVTGKLFSNPFGFLSNLQRGSTFPAAMKPTCLAISASV